MGAHHSNLEKKKSNSQEKCTRVKSQQKKKGLDSSSRNTYQQSTTDSSQKSLAFRLKPKIYRSRTSRSSTERNNNNYNSDTSTTHSNSFKNKFFGAKRRNKKQATAPATAVVDDEEGSGFISPSSSSHSTPSTNDNASNKSHTLDEDDPMIAAAAKLSAKYDEEQVAILSRHSFSPCMVTQNIEFRLETRTCPLLSNCTSSNSDGGYYSHTNSIQSNHSSQRAITNQITDSLRPLPKQDSICHKINKEWLDTSLFTTPDQKNTLISSQDVFLDLFLRPNNEMDRRKEKDRQQRLHYLLKRIWKGIYRPKLDDPKLIVNWCCGIGVWDMEMALLFPNTKIVGVDYKEATLTNLQHDLPNLEFRHTVIHDSFTGLESFETDSVDYIMMRDAWLINTPSSKWENVLRESLRILKPGGWIELTEHRLCIEAQGPCTSRLDDCFDRFYRNARVDREIASKLGQYLADAGFQDIDEQSIGVPLGEWGSTHALKEIGYLFRDIIERRIRGLSKWVCLANHVGEKELNNIITIGMDEELNTYRSHMNWHSYTARKKANTSTPNLSSSGAMKRPQIPDATISQSSPLLQTFPPSPPLIPIPPPTTENSSLAATHTQEQ